MNAPAGHFEPVHLPADLRPSREQFWRLCASNRDWRFELTADGDIVIMPPTGGETGARNMKLAAQLELWSEQDGSGVAFDSSTGFVLPNGAIRSPDAAWVRKDRLATLSREDKEGFLPLCPDFVIELRSRSDRLEDLQEKMVEYTENGARLGWLIDPVEGRVWVYRPEAAVERLDQPGAVDAAPVLPGLELKLGSIWSSGL
jgi:Uma2 family endonuclease